MTEEQKKAVEEDIKKSEIIKKSMKSTIDDLRSKLREANKLLQEKKANPAKEPEFENEEEKEAYYKLKKLGMASTDEIQERALEENVAKAQEEYNKALAQTVAELEKEFD